MNQLSASATNAAATITLAALSVPTLGTSLGAANRIDGLTVSYSGSPTGGRVTILDGAARTVADGVTATNTALTSATAAFTAGTAGNAMSVTLAAGGSAVVGKVNINAISQV